MKAVMNVMKSQLQRTANDMQNVNMNQSTSINTNLELYNYI
jgi:hypothetical protein